MPDFYDPQKHHRRSIRLKDYDYTQSGAYFVTIVAWHRREVFGQVHTGEIQLSSAGQIVWQVWENLTRHFKNITLGSVVVMPNHFHGIIMIEGRGEASAGIDRASSSSHLADASPLRGSRKIARATGRTGSPVWQRN